MSSEKMSAGVVAVIRVPNISGEDEREESNERQGNEIALAQMRADAIAVIIVHDSPCGDNPQVRNEEKENNLSPKEVSKGLCVSFFGIIAVSVIFAVPWTTIPRTDSIIYQSHWMEEILPSATLCIMWAGCWLLELTSWTQERSLMSLFVLLKMYVVLLITYVVFYILCSLIWSVYLGFNHPPPYLGMIIVPTSTIASLGIWFLLPSDLLDKKDFRRKLKVYMLYFPWIIIILIQNELLSLFFSHSPAAFQFLMPFMVAGCRELDKRVRSKIVTKMMVKQDESAIAWLVIAVNSNYAIFIAIRLVGAEWVTIFCTVAIDFVLHLKMTYQITKEFGKANDERTENNNTEKNILITKLVLAELIEGFIPIIYGTCMAMAYYGPNSHILSNVGNTYWSDEIKNIAPLFCTMSILFAVDTLSVVINSLCLWKLVCVNAVQELCRVLGKYWFFLAIHLGLTMAGYFASTDINFGVDGSGSFLWKTHEGRLRLIYNSNDLADKEKAMLLGNWTLI